MKTKTERLIRDNVQYTIEVNEVGYYISVDVEKDRVCWTETQVTENEEITTEHAIKRSFELVVFKTRDAKILLKAPINFAAECTEYRIVSSEVDNKNIIVFDFSC